MTTPEEPEVITHEGPEVITHKGPDHCQLGQPVGAEDVVNAGQERFSPRISTRPGGKFHASRIDHVSQVSSLASVKKGSLSYADVQATSIARHALLGTRSGLK